MTKNLGDSVLVDLVPWERSVCLSTHMGHGQPSLRNPDRKSLDVKFVLEVRNRDPIQTFEERIFSLCPTIYEVLGIKSTQKWRRGRFQ